VNEYQYYSLNPSSTVEMTVELISTSPYWTQSTDRKRQEHKGNKGEVKTPACFQGK
jgi:predicted secreted Zn-dependent protease